MTWARSSSNLKGMANAFSQTLGMTPYGIHILCWVEAPASSSMDLDSVEWDSLFFCRQKRKPQIGAASPYNKLTAS